MPRSPLLIRMSRFMIALENRLKEGRSEATVTKIMSNLRTMHAKMIDAVAPFDSLAFLDDPVALRAKMPEYTTRSYKTYISSAISALDAMGGHEALVDRYRTIHKDLKDVVDEQDDSHEPTAKQAERMVPFSDLVAAREKMRAVVDGFKGVCDKKQYQDVQAYMLLCIATMCSTVMRNQELCKMVVSRKWEKDMPPTCNYFLFEYNIMELHVYKTASTYGKQLIHLSSELGEILCDCLAMRPGGDGFMNGSPMFINQNGLPLTTGGGIQRLYERAGLNISPTIVRNIIATERSGDAVEVVERVQQNARDFGHSVKQHLRYVRKTLENKAARKAD